MKKDKEMFIKFHTVFHIDNLKFGWMCPLCECIYAPTVEKCPVDHKLSKKEPKNEASTWIYDHAKGRK